MANIKVNPTKSTLITNKLSQTHNPTYFNNTLLPLNPPNLPFKFLGCWFTLDNKQTKQTKTL